MINIKLMKKFCVYVDFIEKDGEFIRGYVGKGNQTRVNGKERNKQHQSYAKKYEWKRVVGFETDDESEAFEVEKTLIRELHTFIHDPEKTHYACNQTLGGEGISGYKWNEEQRRELREKCNTPEGKARMSAAAKMNTGKKSAEHRKKDSDALIGKKKTIEHRENLRKSFNTPEVKLKRSGKNNGRAHAVEQYTKDNVFIARYETIAEAILKVGNGHIVDVCTGRRKYACGYYWKYVDE